MHRKRNSLKVYTNLSETVTIRVEGEEMDALYDFKNYRLKVDIYISEE